MKTELMERYCYIYENATNILATSVKKTNGIISYELNRYSLLLLEDFLLGDKPYKSSNLYQYIEHNKNDNKYQEKIREGLQLLKEYNNNHIPKKKLNVWEVLCLLHDFIGRQWENAQDKMLKLKALDEYFKLARYKNDGKIWFSGYEFVAQDLINVDSYTLPLSKVIEKSTEKGLPITKFIRYFADKKNIGYNHSVLTENEKQIIYLSFHDELPWDVQIECPECHQYVFIKKAEMFVNPVDQLYYQECPNCLNKVDINIPEELLPNGMKKQIVKQSSNVIKVLEMKRAMPH